MTKYWRYVFFCLSLQTLSFAVLAQANSSALTSQSAAQNQGSPESTVTIQQLFDSGIKNYREHKFAESMSDFQKIITADKNNVAALTNLALAQFQLGNKGWALALLRKATNLDPHLSSLKQAENFILPQLEVKEIPHEILLSETLHNQILSPLSLFWFSIFTAFFIFSSGWLLLSYLGARKRALEQDLPHPSFSFFTAFFTFGALVFMALTLLKIIDQKTIRATVVASKVAALSSPDEKAPSLFDLYQGLEVIVKQEQLEANKPGWLQVNYPGGPTGWVPQSTVFKTTEN